jgi:hypothetical protein
MALKGNLRDFSTVQLLNLINLARKTGTLTIDGTETQANLSFKGGKLIYAMLDREGDRLTAVLQQAGKITGEQARTILSHAGDRSDKELGRLLISAGHVSQTDVIKSIRAYVLSNVYPLFTWPEGSFYFESSLRPVEDRITVPIDLENVIMEGSRRLEKWERMQEELPNLDVALRFAENPRTNLRDVNLNAEEWRVVSFINPRNTIQQIAQHNNMSDFQIRKIAYGLMQAGLVELVQPEGAATPSEVSGRAAMAQRRPAVKRNVIVRLIDRIREL